MFWATCISTSHMIFIHKNDIFAFPPPLPLLVDLPSSRTDPISREGPVDRDHPFHFLGVLPDPHLWRAVGQVL